MMGAALLFLSTGPAHATNDTWQVDTSFSYLTGKYGTDQNTDLFYVPVTLKRFLGWGDVSLTVPYISIHSSGGLTILNGQAVSNPSATNGTVSGLGDIILKGRYNWIEQEGPWPFVDLVGRVKFPTASSSDGLGTGEFDYGVGVEVARVFNKDYTGFTDLYYTFIGSPPGVSYNNQISFDLGIGRKLTPPLMLSVFYEIRTAIDPTQADAQTLNLFANYKINPRWTAYAIFDVGLSSGAEDYGITGGASYRF